jgi:hypothetical protein
MLRFRRWARRLGGLGLVLVTCLAGSTVQAAASDSQGVEFWLTFPGNLLRSELSLFLTGTTNTTGTVSIPGLRFTAPFSVTAGAVTTVVLPSTASLSTSDGVENKGILVTAQDEVAVYGLNRAQFTTDAYVGLPSDILGTEYIVLSYQNSIVNGSELAIVATAEATTVTITPAVSTGQRPASVPYTLTLGRGQTYQLMNTNPAPGDLTGTIITSDQPIAVFGGHLCANVPPNVAFCDHLVEQLPPVVTWGKHFMTMPLATRRKGDTFRFLASTDGTQVSVNGSLVATLERGQFFEQIIATPAHITADQPILVAQYANGTAFDGVTADPFMMLIPPFEQFLATYTVTTPATGFPLNFVNIVTPNAAVGSITLDSAAIPVASFIPIGSSGFSGAQVPIGLGAHTLNGPLPFGTFVYGFAADDSYGYPGGMSLAPVVIVTSLELTPEAATKPIGSEHCLTALVNDQRGNPVTGVRVDFTVSGANPAVGFEATAGNGQAGFCYSGTKPGTDTIIASVGSIVDTATTIWIARLLRYSDGMNTLEVDSARSAFIFRYVVDGLTRLCSGGRASVDAGLLTIVSRCQEDLWDVLRAIGPIDATLSVQLLDRPEPPGGERVIRRFSLTRQVSGSQ